MTQVLRLVLLTVFGFSFVHVHPYNTNNEFLSSVSSSAQRTNLPRTSRRTFGGFILGTVALPIFVPWEGQAAAAAPPEDDVQILKDGYAALTSLLSNWDRATVDCTYADVPRELLEQKNKAELLEKASTFALFDKSAAVISCKKTNRIVRDYIGVTGKGPLVGAEKKMMKRTVVQLVDPDQLDDYYAEVESFSQALSNAASLSYTAGVADFDSVNNFEKGKEELKTGNTNLEQAQKAIAEAQVSMKKIVGLLS